MRPEKSAGRKRIQRSDEPLKPDRRTGGGAGDGRAGDRVDILTQVSAIQSALNSFNKVLLSSHIKSCVVEDIRQGKEGAVDELCKTIQKLMK